MTTAATRRGIPLGIWMLGLVSLFMDVSSEMIHALLPVFLTSVLGASATSVGWIEGIAEATASITKVFSGTLSDYLGKRKLLAAIGYGLAAFTKPLFPLAHSVGWIVAARFIDRVGKGIRGAPRDALIADLATPEIRGASFGLRQSLDTVGAFVGPLLAALLMALTANAFRTVFWIAVIPALVSVALLVFGVSEPERTPAAAPVRSPIHRAELRRLGPSYWWLVGIAAAFTIARFSEAFLILRAQSFGVSLALVPLVLVAMNLAYAASAYPVGILSDRMGRRGLLAAGFVVLAASQLVLALAAGRGGLLGGVLLWGLHMGMTQGLLAAMVADAAPEALRGTAFGIFHLASGLALLAASVIAGMLWDALGPPATFGFGAGLTVLALAVLIVCYRGSTSPISEST
jgi:MFS family permease